MNTINVEKEFSEWWKNINHCNKFKLSAINSVGSNERWYQYDFAAHLASYDWFASSLCKVK